LKFPHSEILCLRFNFLLFLKSWVCLAKLKSRNRRTASLKMPPPEKSLGLWALLLLVPFVALLWVPFYNSSEPHLLGFPFFYWYQFLWVPITSLLIYIVYLKTR
jgi:Protein of unknown function (DUF3311)